MRRYRDYRSFLESEYGGRVYRLGVDGGFSCPNRNRDGSGGCAFCDGTGSKAAYLRHQEQSLAGTSFNSEASRSVLLGRGTLAEREASIVEQLSRSKEFVKRRYKADLYSVYFQAWTNTYAPVADLKRLYDTALDTGVYQELIVSTRPDEIDEEKAALLASYQGRVHRVWVELGLQSANDETLRSINRGHDSACYLKAAELLHSYGIAISTHVILGLPGEGREQYIATANLVGRAKSEGVKIHNLDICGGTAMLDRFLDGEMGVPSFARHLESTVLFLRHLPASVVVERLLCETPSHRLAAPRSFGAKNLFLQALDETMEREQVQQGDCYEAT